MRGTQKKILYLKNTGSPYFEEAYFILKGGAGNDVGDKNVTRGMVFEANRIIEESFGAKRHGRFKSLILYLLSFFIGGACSFLITFLIIN